MKVRIKVFWRRSKTQAMECNYADNYYGDQLCRASAEIV